VVDFFGLYFGLPIGL